MTAVLSTKWPSQNKPILNTFCLQKCPLMSPFTDKYAQYLTFGHLDLKKNFPVRNPRSPVSRGPLRGGEGRGRPIATSHHLLKRATPAAANSLSTRLSVVLILRPMYPIYSKLSVVASSSSECFGFLVCCTAQHTIQMCCWTRHEYTTSTRLV